MSIRVELATIVTFATLRALPTQLDLFTAIGILGGMLGLILGALLAVLQSSGLYS
jgi:hypothetical protein